MAGKAGGWRWKWRRFRVMSMLEIVWRIRQAYQLRMEDFQVNRGWQPFPKGHIEAVSLFAHANQHHDEKIPIPDSTGITMLLANNIDFFNGYPLHIGIPVAWHKDPKSGKIAPVNYGPSINYRDDDCVGDAKYIWEMGRHQHLIPLAVQYAENGDEACKQMIITTIESWVEDNPFAMGIHWCSTLEVALRLISWAIIHSLLTIRDSAGLFSCITPREKLELAIYQQQWFIWHHLSLYSSANNHLIGELTGLWVSVRVFPFSHSKQSCWAEQAKKMIEQEAEKQVYADGVNKEQALYYHLWVLEYLLLVWCVGIRTGDHFSDAFGQRIIAMAEFLHDMTPNHGELPQIGDSDNGFVIRFDACWPKQPYHQVMSAVSMVFQQSDKLLSSQLYPKAFWFGQMIGKTKKPIFSPKSRVFPRIYKQGGYALLGDEQVHILFDAGSLGYPEIAAHGHADALSFTLAIDGQYWFVDPGTYAYHSKGDWRDYFRGTSAHNTITIDDKDQSESGGPFLWLRHAQAKLSLTDHGRQHVRGMHNGYEQQGVIHQRSLDYNADTKQLLIDDSLQGAAPYRMAVYFHLHPDVKIEAKEKVWQLSHQHSDTLLTLTFQSIKPLHWRVLRGSIMPLGGWFSSALGRKVVSTTLQGTIEINSGFELSSIIQINHKRVKR